MPSDVLEHFDLTTSNFGFSAANVEDLGAAEYTLVTIAVDISSSVSSFKSDMEKCLQSIIDACRHSPRADNLLVRLVAFGSGLTEIHGFKQLMDCNVDDYKNCLNIGGMTALCDATVNATEAAQTYGATLVDGDLDCNGVLIVITDGDDNHSTNTPAQAKSAIDMINRAEALESFVTILVGVNISEQYIANKLDVYQKSVGFTQYVEVDNATTSTLAKLAKFVSKSISAQSQALGTGGPSQSLSF